MKTGKQNSFAFFRSIAEKTESITGISRNISHAGCHICHIAEMMKYNAVMIIATGIS